jgi:hypothetical protein
MIKDVTAALQALSLRGAKRNDRCPHDAEQALWSRDRSIALGEVPESLVAAYSGAGKRHRNTKVQSSRGRSCTGEEACSVSPRSRLVEVGRRSPGGAARRRDFPHGPRSPRSFDPSCSEKQVGIGSISQTLELATLAEAMTMRSIEQASASHDEPSTHSWALSCAAVCSR